MKENKDFQRLVKSYFNFFSASVVEGYGKGDFTTIDTNTIKALKENVFNFSQAKTASELKEMNKLLLDDNGIIKLFDVFKEDVLNLHKNYNENYLQAEYIFAVTSSQNTRLWNDAIKNNGINPYLKYITVGDKLVRPGHKAMNNITLLSTDSFWNKYYPPNGWRCRCTVQSLRDTKKTTDLATKNIALIEKDTPDYFKRNFANEQIIFDSTHPYFNQ